MLRVVAVGSSAPDEFSIWPADDPKALALGTVAQGKDGRFYIVKNKKQRQEPTSTTRRLRGRYWAALTKPLVKRRSLVRMHKWQMREIKGLEDFVLRDVPAAEGDCLFACLAHCWNFAQANDLSSACHRLSIASPAAAAPHTIEAKTVRTWIAQTLTIANVNDFLQKESEIQLRLVDKTGYWPSEWWSSVHILKHHASPTARLSHTQDSLTSCRYLGSVETLRRLKDCGPWMQHHLTVVVFTHAGIVFPETFGFPLGASSQVVCLFHGVHQTSAHWTNLHWQVLDWKNQGGTLFEFSALPACLARVLATDLPLN